MIDSNHPFISNMERGLTVPGLAMIVRLAEALECTLSVLVGVLDRPPRTSRRRARGSKAAISGRKIITRNGSRTRSDPDNR
jgi:transcriptional regulator with XRE-family HTH domain